MGKTTRCNKQKLLYIIYFYKIKTRPSKMSNRRILNLTLLSSFPSYLRHIGSVSLIGQLAPSTRMDSGNQWEAQAAVRLSLTHQHWPLTFKCSYFKIRSTIIWSNCWADAILFKSVCIQIFCLSKYIFWHIYIYKWHLLHMGNLIYWYNLSCCHFC